MDAQKRSWLAAALFHILRLVQCQELSLAELTHLYPSITDEWFTSNDCKFYQNLVDILYLCNDVDIYVIPKEQPSTQDYFPQRVDSLDQKFAGQKILNILTDAGDTTKMYFMNHDSETDQIITFEIFHAGESNVRVQPLF